MFNETGGPSEKDIFPQGNKIETADSAEERRQEILKTFDELSEFSALNQKSVYDPRGRRERSSGIGWINKGGSGAGQSTETHPLTALNNYALYALRGGGKPFQGFGARIDSKEVPIEVAEDAVDRLTRIKKEVENANPDYEKIDAEAARFLQERWDHFIKTLDQRIAARAKELHDAPEEQKQQFRSLFRIEETKGGTEVQIKAWEEWIRQSVPDIKAWFDKVQEKLRKRYTADSFYDETEKIDTGVQVPKVSEIMKRAENILGIYGDPFVPDQFKE